MSITEKLKAARAVAADQLPDALMVGGVGAISAGAGMIYAPAGWIVGGLFALAAGVLVARKQSR